MKTMLVLPGTRKPIEMEGRMSTKLTGIRKATRYERSKRGAEVVFTREDSQGREYTIYACKCYESWEQWGAATDVLSDNCDAVEKWRHESLEDVASEIEF